MRGRGWSRVSGQPIMRPPRADSSSSRRWVASSIARYGPFPEVMMTDPNDALAVLYALRLEDGRPWRKAATDWQLADARAVLAPSKQAPRLHWLSRPKG